MHTVKKTFSVMRVLETVFDVVDLPCIGLLDIAAEP